jgi:L-ascorbate metabolism protein UlaG (beta-lactamase superfamily)
MSRMKIVPAAFVAASFAFPAAAAPHVDPEAVAARRRFFGPENVDARGHLPKDKVIFSWLTNASFAAAIAGRVVLLDTFVTRLEVVPGRVPFVIKDIVDLQPEAIFLGHGHSDHADNAAYIAAKTGATIFASEETCAAMRADFERMRNDSTIASDPVAQFPAGARVTCVDVTSVAR